MPEENVFTFTTQKLHDKKQEAFDIKFIDDCIEAGKILDIGDYTYVFNEFVEIKINYILNLLGIFPVRSLGLKSIENFQYF